MTRYDVFIALLIAIAAYIFLILWIWPGNISRLSDFGLNGLTETIGIAFTVLIIEKLSRKREAERTLPQRLAAYEDIRLLIERCRSFWFQAYMAAVPGDLPKTIQELYSFDSIQSIYNLLHMDSLPNVTPKQTWWSYIPATMEEFRAHSEKILERYNNTCPPKTFLLINKLLNSMILTDCRSLLISDQEHNFPRPRILGNYLVLGQDYFSSLLALTDWCRSERLLLMKESKLPLIEISEYLNGNRANGTPPCMISPELLKSQLNVNRPGF